MFRKCFQPLHSGSGHLFSWTSITLKSGATSQSAASITLRNRRDANLRRELFFMNIATRKANLANDIIFVYYKTQFTRNSSLSRDTSVHVLVQLYEHKCCFVVIAEILQTSGQQLKAEASQSTAIRCEMYALSTWNIIPYAVSELKVPLNLECLCLCILWIYVAKLFLGLIYRYWWPLWDC